MLGGYSYKSRVEGICSAFDPVHGQKGVEQFILQNFRLFKKLARFYLYTDKIGQCYIFILFFKNLVNSSTSRPVRH